MQTEVQITLGKNIAALQLHHANDGAPRTGSISQLPLGAELRVCGEGFNTRTVKVDWRGDLYFVFLQDVEEPEKDERD